MALGDVVRGDHGHTGLIVGFNYVEGLFQL